MSLKRTERREDPQGRFGPAPITADEPRGPEKNALSEIVAHLRRDFTAMWMECGDGDIPAGRTYSPAEQAANGKDLSRFVDLLRNEARRPPMTQEAAHKVRERLLAAGGALARNALGWEDRHIDAILSGGFAGQGMEFVKTARSLGPGLDPDDILQASRNVWVANGLQRLLGLQVRLTPAITAYSLLYPHTDNYLDDPDIPREAKKGFNERLKARLVGQDVSPANPAEKTVFDLVAMIEGDYDRAGHPGVFESLSEIHRAQVESLGLLRPEGSPFEADVLGISLDKGGTSVLADAFLVAGSLDAARIEFAYGLGAFLQLMDDLEDVFEDRKAGRMTIFSQTSKGWPLDGVTSRVLRFGETGPRAHRRICDARDRSPPGPLPLRHRDGDRQLRRPGPPSLPPRIHRKTGDPLAVPFRLRHQAEEEAGEAGGGRLALVPRVGPGRALNPPAAPLFQRGGIQRPLTTPWSAFGHEPVPLLRDSNKRGQALRVRSSSTALAMRRFRVSSCLASSIQRLYSRWWV